MLSIWLAVSGFSFVVPRQGGIGETIGYGFLQVAERTLLLWDTNNDENGFLGLVAQSGLGQLKSRLGKSPIGRSPSTPWGIHPLLKVLSASNTVRKEVEGWI